MTDQTYTLTIDQIQELVMRGNHLGQQYVLDAVEEAGYAADKRKRIEDHINHSNAAMNDIIQAALIKTPEIQKGDEEAPTADALTPSHCSKGSRQPAPRPKVGGFLPP